MRSIIIAIAVAGTLATLTDWLFMGVLFHASYNTSPEVWRPGIREGKDRGGIIWATVLGYAMTTGVVLLCVIAGANTISKGLLVALLAWIAGPPVVIIVNGLFIKIDPKITIAHCIGYLARLALAGAAGGIALGGLSF